MNNVYKILGLLFVGAVGFVGCDQTVVQTDDVEVISDSSSLLVVDEEGNTSIDSEVLGESLSSYSESELTQAEIDGLLQMREEEKLARDVYDALYAKWGTNIFNNIAQSEQTHTDAVAELLDRYSIDDPNVGRNAGEYDSSQLQGLYNSLVAKGSVSQLDALIVGATVEDLDIYDLQVLIGETDNEDIILVYENLMRGSRNHLRSFVKNINNAGGEYSPQYISQQEYSDIVASDIERGGNGYGKK